MKTDDDGAGDVKAAERARLLLWAAPAEVLSACERVLVRAGEARGLDADMPCWACGAGPLVRISMRLNGVEMFWLNACADPRHQQLPLPPAIAGGGRPEPAGERPRAAAAGEQDGYQVVVHNAAGILSARQGISVDAALSRLRQHAAACGLPIAEVARDVVGREPAPPAAGLPPPVRAA